MKTASNIIAVPLNLEELLFINKNKEYGSYILRKSYKKHLMLSCIIVTIAYSLGTTWPLFYDIPELTQNQRIRDSVIIDLLPPPPLDKKPADPVVVIPKMNTVKFTPPVVTPDDKVIDEIFPDIEKLTTAVPWTRTEEGNISGVDITLLEPVESKTKIETENMRHVFTWVEEMPHYPGGQESLLKFITSQIVYPEIAKRAGVQGKIITSFVIERDGSISDIKIEKGIGAGCNEEAARVIAMLDKWEPGKQNGSPVRVRMMIPINFKLQ